MRAILSVRPKCSHRCVSLKETPLKPMQFLSHATRTSTEQTSMRTKWVKISRFKLLRSISYRRPRMSGRRMSGTSRRFPRHLQVALGNVSTSAFQSEVGEVFGEISGELQAKFGRRFSSFFCWGKSPEAFSTKTPLQISPSNFTTRFWVVAGPRNEGKFESVLTTSMSKKGGLLNFRCS